MCCRSRQVGEEEQCQCVIEQCLCVSMCYRAVSVCVYVCLCVSMSVYVCVAGRDRSGRRSSVSRRGRATCCSGQARATTQPSPTTSQVTPSNRHTACTQALVGIYSSVMHVCTVTDTGTPSWTTSQVTPSNCPQALDVNALAISWDDKLWT